MKNLEIKIPRNQLNELAFHEEIPLDQLAASSFKEKIAALTSLDSLEKAKHTHEQFETIVADAKYVNMVLKLEKFYRSPFTLLHKTISLRPDCRVDSYCTKFLSQGLVETAGFASADSPIYEWPVYESKEMPLCFVSVLRNKGIDVGTAADLPIDQEFDEKGVPITDVLGLYYSDREIIVLFTEVIKACAKDLGVSPNVLYEVVLAHELSHAITHRCPDRKKRAWNYFSEASTESKEFLAQLIPFIYLSRRGFKQHLDVMEKLSDLQSGAYNTYNKSVRPRRLAVPTHSGNTHRTGERISST